MSVKQIIKNQYYCIHNYRCSRIEKRKNATITDLIRENKQFRNCHKGEKVYICGNGPSIDLVDFNCLSNKHVITVNWMPISDRFLELKSEYHCLMDPAFFKLRDDLVYDDCELMKLYERIEDSKMDVFALGKGYNYINNRFGDISKDYFHYLMVGESFVINQPKSFDLCDCVPTFTNVVQYAIVIALYMGFEEIYLLGCDGTALIGYIKEILEENDTIPYMTGLKNQNVFKNKLDIEKVIYDQYLLFEGFRYIKNYCDKHNTLIFNCAKHSLVTSIPYRDFYNTL